MTQQIDMGDRGPMGTKRTEMTQVVCENFTLVKGGRTAETVGDEKWRIYDPKAFLYLSKKGKWIDGMTPKSQKKVKKFKSAEAAEKYAATIGL